MCQMESDPTSCARAPRATNLFAQNLIDGSTLLERRLGNHIGAHLLHVNHERIQWLLDVASASPFAILRFTIGSIGGLAARAGRVLAQLAAAVAITEFTHIAAVFVAHAGVVVVVARVLLLVGTGRVGTHLAVAVGGGLGTVLLLDAALAIRAAVH